MRFHQLEHRFVHSIPSTIEPGVLYVSIEFATAIHLCCCGCGREVVTPFTPTDWKLTFDGVSISLWPSIGNWNFPCRSHYIVKENRIIEAAPWSQTMVEAERERDKRTKAAYFAGQKQDVQPTEQPKERPKTVAKPVDDVAKHPATGGITGLWNWIIGKN